MILSVRVFKTKNGKIDSQKSFVSGKILENLLSFRCVFSFCSKICADLCTLLKVKKFFTRFLHALSIKALVRSSVTRGVRYLLNVFVFKGAYRSSFSPIEHMKILDVTSSFWDFASKSSKNFCEYSWFNFDGFFKE